MAFPVEKTGDIAGVDDAVALLLDGVDFVPAAEAPPPPALRASCHAFARALASARASFLLFFDVELSSAPPPPPANEVSAFRFGMLLSYFCLSLASFVVRSIDFAFAALFFLNRWYTRERSSQQQHGVTTPQGRTAVAKKNSYYLQYCTNQGQNSPVRRSLSQTMTRSSECRRRVVIISPHHTLPNTSK